MAVSGRPTVNKEKNKKSILVLTADAATPFTFATHVRHGRITHTQGGVDFVWRARVDNSKTTPNKIRLILKCKSTDVAIDGLGILAAGVETADLTVSLTTDGTNANTMDYLIQVELITDDDGE